MPKKEHREDAWFLTRDDLRILWEILHETREILTDVREILKELQALKPHLAAVKIQFNGAATMDTSIQVGATTTAKVVGFDQFNNPFPIDFTANPVTWAIDQPNAVGLAPATEPDSEICTGLAATTTPAVLTATCAGFNGTGTITVTEAPPPTPVLSSIQVQFS